MKFTGLVAALCLAFSSAFMPAPLQTRWASKLDYAVTLVEDGTETTINAGDSYLVDKPHLPEIIGDETVIMHEFSQQVKKVLDSMKD